VIVLHVAAMVVQRVARGFLLRAAVGGIALGSAPARVPSSCRRTAAAVQARHANRPPKQQAVSGAARGAENTELTLVARYLEAKVRRGPAAVDIQFNDWILMRMQAWARMVPWRAYSRSLRNPVFNIAARSIQAARKRQLRRRMGLEPPVARDGPFSRERAAFLIERAWRGFTNRRIFGYLREMLLFREQGDAKELLRCINPREAGLIDVATKIHVRFRLGGSLFPPAIYYKVYTHAPVADVGAFAPRDYTATFQPPPVVLHNKEKAGERVARENRQGWYRRVENNGWRPVSDKLFEEADEAELCGTAKAVEWHHVKLERRENLAKRRKQKKLEWLQKMYAQGRSADGAGAGAEQGQSADGEGTEEELDALLQWSDSLDFDSYYQDWLGLATSARPTWQRTNTSC